MSGIALRKTMCFLSKTVMLLLFICLFIIGCEQPTTPITPIEPEDSSPSTKEEMLEGLGITLEDTEPTNNNGAVGDGNPLGNKLISFIPKYEVFLTDLDGSNIYTGSTAGLTELEEILSYSSNTSWMDYPKKAVNADMDGDGYDEIVIVVLDTDNGDIQVRVSEYSVVDGVSSGPNNILIEDEINLSNLDYVMDLENQAFDGGDTEYMAYFKRDATAGDFDNDGTMEVVFSVSGHVFIFNHSDSGTYSITEVINDLTGTLTRVEAADLNKDCYCDLVLLDGQESQPDNTSTATTASYYIFEGSESGLGLDVSSGVATSDFTSTLMAGTYGFSSADMAIADINNDNWNDIVFGGVRGNDLTKLMYTVIDPFNETSKTLQQKVLFMNDEMCCHTWGGDVYYRYEFVPRVVAGNFDGELGAEFGILDYFFTCNENGDIVDFNEGPFGTIERNVETHNWMYFDNAIVGDVTGDCIDDLVFLQMQFVTQYPNKFDKLKVWGSTSSTQNDLFLEEMPIIWLDKDKVTHPTLSMANINNDSTILKFNRRELEYTGPQILAIMASPPYNEHMNIDNSATEYTTTTGTDSNESRSAGFSVGATFGFGFGLGLFEICSFERHIEVTTEESFAWGWEGSTSKSVSYTSTCPAGTNSVRFTVFPIDVYIYDVLSKPADSSLGDTFTINIPRDPVDSATQHWDVEVYNSRVSEEYQIPDEMLQHVMGDPYSYYNKGEIEANNGSFTPGYYTVYDGISDTVSVGDGLLSSISMTQSSSDGSTYDFSASAGVGYSETIAVVDYSVSAGFDYGYSCSNSSFEEFSIAGTLGALPATAPSDAGFTWGPVVIKQSFNDQNYDLITYWVE